MRFLKELLTSKSTKEDRKRKEFILNVLLFSVFIIFLIATLVDIFATFYRPYSHEQSALSYIFLFISLLGIVSLYLLSRSGFPQLSAGIFIFLFFILSVYMSMIWGN